MDLDEMLEELTRLQEKLKTLDPTTEAYSVAAKNYKTLVDTLHSELEARDSELDHEAKRELDKAKLRLNEIEEKNRVRQGTWDAILGVGKLVLSVAGTFGAIILTGTMEESTILSQKCFSLIRGLLPKG